MDTMAHAPLLPPVAGLIERETARDWNGAIDLLWNQWNERPGDARRAARLLVQCWIAVLEYGCEAWIPKDTDWRLARQYMRKCATYAQEAYPEDFVYCWAMAYITSEPWAYTFQLETDGEDGYDHWNGLGKQARATGRRLYGGHPAGDLFFRKLDTRQYRAAQRAIMPYLDALFPDESEMGQYFRRMYTENPEMWDREEPKKMKQYQVAGGALAVPAIVTGCMRIAQMEPAEVEAFIHASLESGVNMFDHADIYGGGESETRFGKALRANPGLRDGMIIQSKCGIGKGMYDASGAHIIKSVEGILSRLGIDRLDVLLLHRPDALMEPGEVAEAVERLREMGKIGYFGVSNQNPAQMALLSRAIPLHFNQLQFGLGHTAMVDRGINVNTGFDGAIDRDGGALDYCRLHGITVQAWSPFQHGFFEGVFIDNPKFPALNAQLQTLADEKNVTKSAIAAAWILRHPAGMQVITGTTKPQRIREIAEAAKVEMTRREWYDLYLAAGHKLP